MTRTYLVLFSLVAMGLLGACSGSGPSCATICAQSMAQGCAETTDCARFCPAADNVAAKGMCQSQYATYKTCVGSLQGAAICQAFMTPGSCNAETQAVTQCGQNYCAAHLSDPDCQTLISLMGP